MLIVAQCHKGAGIDSECFDTGNEHDDGEAEEQKRAVRHPVC